MTQVAIVLEPADREAEGQRQQIAALFRSRPNQAVPVTEIIPLALCGWRTRISELRRPKYGAMNLVNVQTPVGRKKHSAYRYVVDG